MNRKNEFAVLTSQNAILSQAQQYSLKLLQMNNLELREYIKEQLEENPFLIEKDRDDIFFESNFVNNYRNGSYADKNLNFSENITDKISNYRDDMQRQMIFAKLSEDEKEIADILIEEAKEKYFTGEFFKNLTQEKKIDYKNILKIIEKIKKVFPAGMFAFNLQDRLKAIFESQGEISNVQLLFLRNLDLILSKGIFGFQKKYRFLTRLC